MTERFAMVAIPDEVHSRTNVDIERRKVLDRSYAVLQATGSTGKNTPELILEGKHQLASLRPGQRRSQDRSRVDRIQCKAQSRSHFLRAGEETARKPLAWIRHGDTFATEASYLAVLGLAACKYTGVEATFERR